MAVRQFLLPDLGEGLEDAEIVAWRVGVGDRVELNQTVAEVNTAKALVEVPAPWEGVIEALHAAEGDVVAVGAPLFSMRVEEGSASAGGEPGPAPTETAPDAAETAPAVPARRPHLVGYGVAEEEAAAGAPGAEPPAGTPRPTGPVPSTPPVRRLAKDLGVDLRSLPGSGPGGRVVRDDVVRAAARQGPAVSAGGPQPPGAGRVTVVPVRGTRRLIAEKMTRSVREIPHVTAFLDFDATSLQAFREEIARDSGERVSPLPVVVRALAAVCAEHPKLNATFDAERFEIRLFGTVNVGIATETEQGLLVPVVRDAAAKGIAQIATEISGLAEAARAGRLTPAEMSGGTITVSNVGSFGSAAGTPIINHPEAAVLALGVVEPRALVVDGKVVARPAATLSLSFDHRLLDGAEAGRALRALADVLESPFRLGALPR